MCQSITCEDTGMHTYTYLLCTPAVTDERQYTNGNVKDVKDVWFSYNCQHVCMLLSQHCVYQSFGCTALALHCTNTMHHKQHTNAIYHKQHCTNTMYHKQHTNTIYHKQHCTNTMHHKQHTNTIYHKQHCTNTTYAPQTRHSFG